MAPLPERSCFKIAFIYYDSVAISDSLACDLTQKEIITLKCSHNQGRPSLGMAQIRKRERDYNNISLYKSRQASSSPSLNQSFLREDSLAIELSDFSLMFLVLSNRTNSRTSSRDASGTCSISFRISSFLLINHPCLFELGQS